MMKLTIAFAVLAAATPTMAQTKAPLNRSLSSDPRSADASMAHEWTTTNVHMKRLDAGDRTRGGGYGFAAALLAGQRAWLQFRDSQCAIETGEFSGGSLQSSVRDRCLTRMAYERTKQLVALRWNR